MGVLANLIVKIGADISGFDKDVSKAQAKISKFGSDLSSVGQSLALGISAPLIGMGAVALKSAGDIEALKLGLVAVTGSTKTAAIQFEQLKNVAKLPGLGLQEAVRGAINLQAVGFEAGKAQTILLQFGNALASVGRGREDLEEVVRQLGQMASRGKVTADNLKPILERVPQAATIIRKEFGTIDSEVLQKMGVSAERFTDVLLRGLGDLTRVTGGVKNDIENLKDSWTIATAAMGDAIAPLAKEFIDGFAVPVLQKFEMLSKGLQGTTVALAGITAVAPLMLIFAGSMIQNFTLMAGVVTKLGGAAAAAGVAIRGVAWIALAYEIGNLAFAYMQLIDARDAYDKSGKDQVTRTWDMIHAVRAQIGDNKALNSQLTNLADRWTTGAITLTELNKAIREMTAGLKPSIGITKEVATTVEDLSNKIVNHTMFIKGWGTAQKILDMTASQMAHTLDVEVVPALQNTKEYTEDLTHAFPALNAAFGNLLNKELATAVSLLTDTEIAMLKFKAALKLDPGNEMQTKEQIEGLKALHQGAEKTGQEWKKLGNQVSTIMTDMSRGIADLIFKGGKFKDVWVGALKEVGKAFVRFFIEQGINAAINRMAKLFDISTRLPSIFGGAGGAAKTAGSAAGDMGGVTKSASGAIGAATSGLAGIVTAVSSAITAISSVVQNFQLYAVNKSLDLIEHNTRYAQLYLLTLIERANEFWPYLRLSHELNAGLVLGAMRDIRDNIKNAFSVKLNLTEDEQTNLLGNLNARIANFDMSSADHLFAIYSILGEVNQSIRDSAVFLSKSLGGKESEAMSKEKKGILKWLLGPSYFIGKAISGILHSTVPPVQTRPTIQTEQRIILQVDGKVIAEAMARQLRLAGA